ncbi:unnamed protein product [Cyclocybe aegerita]|uniref:Reverse transcriptase domain-containing protein n=1 Tax=Cyclocybe aegerita TaxID=1973307 RepID=A0A8S0X708_CYCAE|nr:unnamed protein product [Cyclocybe aegerita]
MKLFYIKAAPLNMMLLSFVDDGTILAQSKHLDDNNVGLRKAYKIINLLFVAFTLVLEHNKDKLFHFLPQRDTYNPSLDLGYTPHTGATPLKPKTYWRYLGFYFDCRLTFHEHVHYYATKAFTTVQAMRMLGNCGLEALAGLIPIHLMLKKLATRAVYRIATLSDTHPLHSMMGKRLLKWAEPHACSATLMTPAMRGKVKSTVMEVDKRVHTLTESFEPFAPEARPGDQLLDRYADRLCFDEHDPTQDGPQPTDLPRWRCWKWGHPTVACKAKQLSCPICSGPHEQKEHRQHAGCCKGNTKVKPPVLPTPHDQPCPHKGRCVNCHKDRAANSALCKFWAHRYEREWIMAEYRQLQMVHIKEEEVPRVIAYVSTRLSRYCPAMHHDILVLSLFSVGEVLNLMNIYSDDQHTAIEHLAARMHSLPPFIYMAGDFNCVSTTWDDYEHGESSTAISLRDTASQIGLEWARPSNHGPTRISPNPNQRSNVLDLVFLAPSEILISMPRLEHDLQGPSDHVPICTDLDIGPEPPGSGRWTIKPGSEAEKSFISDILRDLAAIPVAAPATKEGVEALADAIATAFSDAWLAHSTESKPTKRSKSWWTDECSETFGVYQLSRLLADYNKFKKACKDAKRDFFDERITEIATSCKRPWDLMEWVKQRKLPPCEAIRNGNQPCHDMDDLWDTLHSTYNSASGREYDASVLDELPDKPVREWADFSEHELLSALKGYSNSSAPGPDHVTWVHLKELLKDKHVLALFIVLANACLQVGHWPRIFKESLSVIVPKPNKPSYAVPKAFRLIVLLITFGKLIEKMIANRIQFDAVKHDIFHPNQLGGIRQRSTEDAGLILTHLVQAGWVKGLQTSALAFDIAQFFPSINHEMFMAVLRKQGFSPVLVEFFASYLVGRSTVYCWNTFQSDSQSADVGVGQGSALSPVISGLFIAPVMKLFYVKAAPLNTTLLSFVDDGTILAQSKQLDDNNVGLHKAYKIIYLLFVAFALVLEHDKTELFHFSRRRDAYNPSLDLGYALHTSATPLKPKT